MTRPCRPDPTRPRPDVERAREDCTHPAEYRQPGGLCGCCGWDGFGVNTCVTCDLTEDRWDPTDPLFDEGAAQCPGCKRFDLEEMEQAA